MYQTPTDCEARLCLAFFCMPAGDGRLDNATPPFGRNHAKDGDALRFRNPCASPELLMFNC